MSGSGTTTIAAGGALTISGSNKYLNARVLTNAGTVTWTGNGADLGGTGTAATINNSAGAVFDVQNNQSLYFGNGLGHTFNNAGLFKKSAGTSLTSITWAFNNTGTVEVQTGSLYLGGGGTRGCHALC